MAPLALNLEFIGTAELDFTRCIAACVTAFANGMAPVTAVELGRRGMSSDLRPTADELEEMFKSLKNDAGWGSPPFWRFRKQKRSMSIMVVRGKWLMPISPPP